jgi:cobalt-zinc-cadmium efflux system outer membrane protein
MAMIRTTAAQWWGACALQALLLSVAPFAAAVDDPGELTQEALVANPGIEALQARVAELGELAGAAGTWADPVVALEYSNVPVDSFSLNDHPMSALQFRVEQTIPPWGWSRLRENVADSLIRTSEHALEEAKTQLRREVFVLFWQLTLSRMLQDVTQEHVTRTDELVRAVRARYETGAAGQHQLLRLQLLRDRLRDDLGDFVRVDRELSTALSRSLSRPPDAVFRTPERLEARQVDGEYSGWLRLAREQRHELRRIEESIETEKLAAELARVDGTPDVTVWGGYRVRQIDTTLDDGTDQVSVGVSVPIPWGSGQRSRAERAARLQAARGGRAQLAAELDRIESELVAIHARWMRAFEQAVEYRDHLAPDAKAALETSLSDYTVGRADFSTLYEAEVDLLNLERTQLSATVETHIQEARASAIIGVAPNGGQR